jgi:hypothetical protein
MERFQIAAELAGCGTAMRFFCHTGFLAEVKMGTAESAAALLGRRDLLILKV